MVPSTPFSLATFQFLKMSLCTHADLSALTNLLTLLAFHSPHHFPSGWTFAKNGIVLFILNPKEPEPEKYQLISRFKIWLMHFIAKMTEWCWKEYFSYIRLIFLAWFCWQPETWPIRILKNGHLCFPLWPMSVTSSELTALRALLVFINHPWK